MIFRTGTMKMNCFLTVLFVIFLSGSGAFFHPQPLAVSKAPKLNVNNRNIVIEEIRNDGTVTKLYLNDNNGNSATASKRILAFNAKRSLQSMKSFFQKLFLPAGYPQSVPKEYVEFQAYNLIQDFCSYLRQMLSTNAILSGMGVGRSDITPMHATLQWMLRDGVSMIGGLVFTSLLSLNFGQNVKQWRFFADMVNNVGITVYMLAPLFPKYFLVLICLGSIFTTLCGVAAGATNAVINSHWGAHGNLADVMSKNHAQHIIISLLGLMCSMTIARRFDINKSQLKWVWFAFLTLTHIFCNYKAVRLVALTSLNITRYDLLLQQFLQLNLIQNLFKEILLQNSNNKNNEKFILKIEKKNEIEHYLSQHFTEFSASEVAKIEPIIPFLYENKNIHKIDVKMWSDYKSIQQILHSHQNNLDNNNNLEKLIKFYENSQYIILSEKNLQTNEIIKYHLIFKSNAIIKDFLQGYFEIAILLKLNNNLFLAKKLTKEIFPLFYEMLIKNHWQMNLANLTPKHFSFLNINFQ